MNPSYDLPTGVSIALFLGATCIAALILWNDVSAVRWQLSPLPQPSAAATIKPAAVAFDVDRTFSEFRVLSLGLPSVTTYPLPEPKSTRLTTPPRKAATP